MARQHAYSEGYVRTTAADDVQRHTERLLFQVPIYVAVALGGSLMLTRFILVLNDNLKSSPDGWRSVLLLAVIMGAASLVIIAACAAVGVVIGFALRAAFAKALAAHLSHPLAKHY